MAFHLLKKKKDRGLDIPTKEFISTGCHVVFASLSVDVEKDIDESNESSLFLENLSVFTGLNRQAGTDKECLYTEQHGMLK